MTTSDTVAVAIMIVIVAVHAIILLIRLLPKCGSWPRMISSMGGCIPWNSSQESVQEPDDGQQNRAAARLAEIRAQSYVAFLHIWLQVGAVYAALYILRWCLGLARLSDTPMVCIFGLSYLTALAVMLRPSMVNKDTLWVLHLWMMGIVWSFAAYVIFRHGTLSKHYYTQMLVLRVSLSFAYPVAGMNFCWNIAHMLIALIGDFMDDDKTCGVPIHNTITNEILIVAFFTHVLWKYEQLQVSQVYSDLQANGYLRAKKTMERLLSDMCDAVVELDHNLNIRQACPKLAGLLLRHTGNNSLKDETFENLAFNDDEGQRFRDFVMGRAVPMEHEQNYNGDRNSNSMYLSLRDSTGTAVSVQIFHSCHHDPPDEVCHIVGVHEVEHDNAGGGRDTLGQAGQPEGQRERKTGDAESVVSVASSGASDMAVELAPLIPEASLQYPTGVMFNCLTNEVIACTVGFQSLTGPLLFKAKLKDYIPNYADFCAWAHEEVNGMLLGELPTAFTIKVAPPGCNKKACVKFEADAYILRVREGVRLSEMGVEFPVDADEEYELLGVMVLGKTEARSRHSKARGGNKAPDAGTPPRKYEVTL